MKERPILFNGEMVRAILDEILKLDAEATKGPWYFWFDPGVSDSEDLAETHLNVSGTWVLIPKEGKTSEIPDSKLIATYRNETPKLARALKTASEALARVQAETGTSTYAWRVSSDALAEIKKELGDE